MTRERSGIVSLLLIVALLVSLTGGSITGNDARAADAQAGFQDLNQSEIVQAMGAGWNLGNQLEANLNGTPQEDGWTNVMVTERLIRAVKTNGFKSIRIPVSWLSKIGKAPDYTIDQEWMDRVQEVVDWAVKYNLYVIINIHGDGYSTVKGGWLLPDKADQGTIKEKYESVWKQIAERFKNYDQHLIFESMNEVGAGIEKKAEILAAYQNINAYNQIFVDTVRQSGGNNDKRWLLIPGLNTDIGYTVGDYGFQIPEDAHLSAEIPEDEKRLMISVHYYTPWEFCGLENYKQTQWGDEADPSKSVGYGGESEMEEKFASLKDRFTSQGYPVVIGEYGSIDKSKKKDSGLDKEGSIDPLNTEFRAFYAWKLCRLSIQNGCIPVYWDNGWNGDLGFAILSRGTAKDKELGYRSVGSVTQPEILSAIVGCYGVDKGDATAISLDQTMLQFELTDSPKTLVASLTPTDAGDTIAWESSDSKVASVSYKGKVTPKGVGTCLITASVPNGPSAYCIVKVTRPKSFKAGLYAMTSSWSTLECGDQDYITIDKNGTGNYTMTLSGTADLFRPFRTLYIKDVTVHRGVAEESLLTSADFVIKSIHFNDTEIPLARTTYSYNKEFSDGVADITIMNVWYEDINCMALENYMNEEDEQDVGYIFPTESYVKGSNTLAIDFEIQDAVLNLEQDQAETEWSTLELPDKQTVETGKMQDIIVTAEPDNATEKILWFSENIKIANVDQNGRVTGIKEGVTNIHALTASGIDAFCQVTVSTDPLAATEPPLPSIEPEVTENPDSTGEPTKDPSGNTGTPKPAPTKDPSGNTGTPKPNPTEYPEGVGTPNPSKEPAGAESTTKPNQSASTLQPNQTSSGGSSTGETVKKPAVKKVSIKKVISKKKKTAVIQWKKLSSVTGYQIKLGTNRKMTKGKKTVLVKKAKISKKTIRKLKSKKKYYVKIRAYRIANGKKHYGAWSKTKKVRVK